MFSRYRGIKSENTENKHLINKQNHSDSKLEIQTDIQTKKFETVKTVDSATPTK